MLAFRHADGSNQLGDLAPGALRRLHGLRRRSTRRPDRRSRTAGSRSRSPTRRVYDVQKFVGAAVGARHAIRADFGGAVPSGVRPQPATRSAGYAQQVEEIIDYSANLDRPAEDDRRVLGGRTRHRSCRPATGCCSRSVVARRDSNTRRRRREDVLRRHQRDARRQHRRVGLQARLRLRAADHRDPLPHGGSGRSARGPGPSRGRRRSRGEQWQAYQPGAQPTPAFPEFSSGHSAFSAAAAEVLRSFTGSDAFGNSVTVQAGTSAGRAGPRARGRRDAELADVQRAPRTRRGCRGGRRHPLRRGRPQSRAMGRKVGAQAWAKAQSYFASPR